ncbi:MAG: zinc metallopeptidase [Hyphomicrobiales bacterium]|nr:zinc metallopeptidase [Hyphomicrobiales bacterium]
MELEDLQSANIEDRRGDSSGIGIPGLGGGGHLGLGAMIAIGLVSWFFHIDPRLLIGGAQMLQGGTTSISQSAPSTGAAGAPTDKTGRFVSAILAETEVVWGKVLPEQKGIAYANPKLVLYNGVTQSACGGRAEATMGPFYCPVDQKVYLDTSFFADMRSKYGGGGDFPYAYVIAHEIGHHVENLLGILPRVEAAQQRATSPAEANRLSVGVELMADCLAGVWAANADAKWHILQPGDVEKAIATASAIGDDRLEKQAQGYVVPDSFTHGTSAQRVFWLKAGLKSGQIDSCNTFSR